MSKENGTTLLDKLTNDVDEAFWELLAPHHEREALFMVQKPLELPPVGLAMTNDEVEYIRKWLAAGDLYRPTQEQIDVWNEEQTKFKYLIIQPYVIAQIESEDLQ